MTQSFPVRTIKRARPGGFPACPAECVSSTYWSSSVVSLDSRYGDDDGTEGGDLSSAAEWRHACFHRPTVQAFEPNTVQNDRHPDFISNHSVWWSRFPEYLGSLHWWRTSKQTNHCQRMHSQHTVVQGSVLI